MGLKTFFSSAWGKLTSLFGGGGYAALDPRKKTIDRVYQSLQQNRHSANQILSSGLHGLRAYGRSLERNNPIARSGIEALVALVVGNGIQLEPRLPASVGKRKRQAFQDAWNDWLATCTTDGCSMYELQRRTFRDIPAAGEGVWRILTRPQAEAGGLPVTILPLESEWIADDIPVGGTITQVAGIETDRYGLPTHYWLGPPEKYSEYEHVPASQVVHIYEARRSLQLRGESWFAPLIDLIMNDKDFVDTELYSAKQCAALGIAITSEYHDDLDTGEDDDGVQAYGSADDPVQTLQIGSVVRMYPGEDVKAFGHDRPSQGIKEFRGEIRGDIAACLRLPRRFFDRNVSDANYSSMRADMLDQQALLAPVRDWFGHQTIGRMYREVLPYLLVKSGITEPCPCKYRLLPDEQPYIDPQKDIAATIEALDNDLTTREAEAAKRGKDWRDIQEQRLAEMEYMAERKLALQVKVQQAINKAQEQVDGLSVTAAALLGDEEAPAPTPPPAEDENDDEEAEPDESDDEDRSLIMERDGDGRLLRVRYENA